MRKKILIFFLIIILIGMCGCQTQADTQTSLVPYSLSKDTPVTLWLVTEETTADGMNQQAQLLIDQFCVEYPNVTVTLDILPTEDAEREAYIQELYSLMESGNGPDIFLLPTSKSLTLDQPQQYTYKRITPLFPDVNLAMRQGYFLDIRGYYDSDASLGKEALNTTVMDAGVVDNARYVLPLRFNLPIMYVFTEDFEALNADITKLESGIDDWMAYVIGQNDPVLALSGEYITLNAFSDLIDYDRGEVLLTQETVADYLQAFQKIQSLIGTEVRHRSRILIRSLLAGKMDAVPAQIIGLDCALDYAAISQAANIPIAMYPIPSDQGDYIASITYYTAIGANCEHPDYAYELCRLFLSEESQWEQTRLKPETEQYPGLMEKGWPVRTEGSVTSLWENYKMQSPDVFTSGTFSGSVKETMLSLELDNASIPVLQTPLSAARFPADASSDFSEILSRLNDYQNNNAPTDADIDALAEEFLQILQNSIKTK